MGFQSALAARRCGAVSPRAMPSLLWLSRLLLETADAVGEALVLAVHCPQFGQDEPDGSVEAHDHRGQHLHVVAHHANLLKHALLLASEEFESDRFVGHG